MIIALHSQRRLIESRWFYATGILAVHALLLLTFVNTSSGSLLNLYGAQKFSCGPATLYLLVFAAGFSAAFLVGSVTGVHVVTALLAPSRQRLTPSRLFVTLLVCGALVVIGHVSLFYVGRSVMKHLEEATAAKQEAVLTGTHAPLFLMALTPLFGALLGYALLGQRSTKVSLLSALVALPVLLCVCVRFLYFERLPLFELGTPVAWFLARRLRTRTLLLLVLLGFVGFFGLFSVAEYFRSWPLYLSSGLYRNTPSDFVQFMFYRVMGYYITPVNHLNMIVREHFGGSSGGFYTFRFMVNAPVVGKALTENVWAFHSMAAKSDGIWKFLLDPQYGLNPEYNMFGFYGVAFLDWGWAGVFLAAFFGLIGGTLLRCSCRGLTLGVLGFPIFLIGLADCPRLLYWSHERVFLSVVTLLLLSVVLPRTSGAEEGES